LSPQRKQRHRPVVVKIGGSLFDLPDLGPRLETWLGGPQSFVLVPGGGPTTDVVRDLDCTHRLGEEAAHWLALRSLSLNAWFLSTLLPGWNPQVVERAEDCGPCWRTGALPVFDCYAFALNDEGLPGCLPHRWSVTSDSLAARVARVLGAGELILLKSVTIPERMDWAEAGREGLVDSYFATAAQGIPSVRAINFRAV
jgi:aspartokinase-like uncharacterized kinase